MSLAVGINSYISLEDAEAYFAARLHSSKWTGASSSDKPAALMQATRMLDELMEWIGVPSEEGQSLRWPRQAELPYLPSYPAGFEPLLADDSGDLRLRDRDGTPIETDAIPAKLKDAVCEQAIYLLSLDPTQKPTLPQKGFSSAGAAGMTVVADSEKRPDLLCQTAIAALAGLGSPLGGATVGGARIGYLGRA